MATVGGHDSGQHRIPKIPDLRAVFQTLPGHNNDAESRTPDQFAKWRRTRRAGTRAQISALGRPTAITSASTGTGKVERGAEYDCWAQFCAAIRTADAGDTAAAAEMLPAEIASAEWDADGRHYRIRRPGSAARAVTCVRRIGRRGLNSIAPLSLLGPLSQPIAGGATAVGVLIAPVIPAPHQPPPAAPGVTRTLDGDIYRPAPHSAADATPAAPGAPLRTLPLLPPSAPTVPGQPAGRDTAPTPLITVSAPRRTAVTPAPTPTVTTPSPDPTPTSTPTEDSIGNTPTPTPEPTITDSPAPALVPTIERLLKPRHHWWHHPRRRGGRGRP